MPEFKKGQLVAVRDAEDCEWKLRVYDHASPEGLNFCVGLERSAPPCWWNQIAPAEVVWPHLFLSVEREVAKALRKQRDQHYRQVRWLCEQLKTVGDNDGAPVCPPMPTDDCQIGCVDCWEKASMEATEEDADGTSEESPALG